MTTRLAAEERKHRGATSAFCKNMTPHECSSGSSVHWDGTSQRVEDNFSTMSANNTMLSDNSNMKSEKSLVSNEQVWKRNGHSISMRAMGKEYDYQERNSLGKASLVEGSLPYQRRRLSRRLNVHSRCLSYAIQIVILLGVLPGNYYALVEAQTPTPNSLTTGAPALGSEIEPPPTSFPTTSTSSTPTVTPITLPPTLRPTAKPTGVPSISPIPTFSPTTATPTVSPTMPPTELPSVSPTKNPTDSPTGSPRPTTSPKPTPLESAAPTNLPTVSPTLSLEPSVSPSGTPTISARPSSEPSIAPTNSPSTTPSTAPTGYPTLVEQSLSTELFSQRFEIAENRILNETEIVAFCEVFESYTAPIQEGILNFDNTTKIDLTVNTTCAIERQSVGQVPSRQFVRKLNLILLQVDYTMQYESNRQPTDGYPLEFQKYVNRGLGQVETDLQGAGVSVTGAGLVILTSKITLAPTQTPSDNPTISALPSQQPSIAPTTAQSGKPTVSAPPSGAPSTGPSVNPSGPSSTTIVATIVTVVGGSVILVSLLVYYRRRKRTKEHNLQYAAAHDRKGDHEIEFEKNANNGFITQMGGLFGLNKKDTSATLPQQQVTVVDLKEQNQTDFRDPLFIVERDMANKEDFHHFNSDSPGEHHHMNNGDGGMIPPNDSLESNQSLISAGFSMSSDSDNEPDFTQNLVDVFEEFKDQNLEKMRTEVEGNLTGFDGMMSQALTKALMDDDDSSQDMGDLMWGGTGDSMEIEASVLCDMNDWLKRKEGASVDERRAFMQETLNKMVSSVRHGIIAPEEASRTIHGCAAMLGLQLAEDIPETTLIVTGMRKMVERGDVIEAFLEFGEIENAAVAPNARGFGLVRFNSPKSVNRAIERFRTGEIVVQDVAVMIKVLRSDAKKHLQGISNSANIVGPAQVPPPMPNGFPAEVEMNRQYSGENRRGGGGAALPRRVSSRENLQAMAAAERRSSVNANRPRGQPRAPGSDTGSQESRRSRGSSNAPSQQNNGNGSQQDAPGGSRKRTY